MQKLPEATPTTHLVIAQAHFRITTKYRLLSCILFLQVLLPPAFASGYRGDLAAAWESSSVVALGTPRLIGDLSAALKAHRASYSLQIDKIYKGGAKAGETIEFGDPYFFTTAGLPLVQGRRYLIFIQSKADRERFRQRNAEGYDATGLQAFPADDENLKLEEIAIEYVKTYETTFFSERKKLILNNLGQNNRFLDPVVTRQVLVEKVTESIPYFRSSLTNAATANAKLRIAQILRCLGDREIREPLLSWLSDNSFTNKAEIVRELVKLGDPSLTPAIGKYTNSNDAYLAGEARIALLQLRVPGSVALLIDTLQNSQNKTARYNAIHTLHWGYTGPFSENEKIVIRSLVKDPDESVARVAGFIVEKW